MTHIVVLTSKPGKGILNDTLLGEITSDLKTSCTTGQTRVLANGHAVEISVTGLSDPDFKDVLARFAEKVPVDFNLVPLGWRRKKLLIADMDSTIITSECIDEIADFAGLKEEISSITERAMRGELELRARFANGYLF